ncbi:hypothetical protein DVJ78_03930 [Humibacter sp. BT305]|uniref:Uncharacterized protein n=1 Tax=Cnuibacter physcomitrellae TaxID=1619308 RepID=A0A1X9LQZ2_9MICO|nr:hypothetical protein [Cnuibacter physcomitrellae]ARJ06738.1 hypothetical protein B5808_17030 [Cnuibacter physcomitrellae]AXH34672.1 hypothetical protein DVJ78_03930 [Humibacter sp. BT305]MCS5497908.1 hypothetical protein [Cnuibacter physcomitrellae]GGI38716.1 hypothetical protein GCM10010988_20410 [Cnuibacter physcomitrellae]
MSDEGTAGGDGLGKDGTIPDDPNGLAAGHVPDGSHFNHEEDTQGVADGSADEGDDLLAPETDFGPDGNPVNGAE